MYSKSEEAFKEARKHLVGGVNSPVRAYRNFDFSPPFIARARGAHLWDADGNEYVDYVGSWGVMILGHAHSEVVAAIKLAAEKGVSFGAPTEAETELAAIVKEAFPSIDLIRFVSSGTEATMSAIRAARGFTARDKVIKFNGCYHGHSDQLLVKAGSGGLTFGEPDSAGVPRGFAGHTLVAEYNDLSSVERLVEKYRGEIAAIIVEPIAGNMGCVPPAEGFLKGLRKVSDDNGIVLIFDEVITGFRVAFGGAQDIYKIRPDMTCLGKIVGGGLPMGAYGGRRDIMEKVSPLGPVYQAGTLSGNPLAVAAGLTTLKWLREGSRSAHLPPQGEGELYSALTAKTERLTTGITRALEQQDIPHAINRVGSIFSVFFGVDSVKTYQDVTGADKDMFKKFFVHMLNRGIYLAPSPFESAFVSTAHSDGDIKKTLEVLSEREIFLTRQST